MPGKCQGRSHNRAIPHLNSRQIASLFREEGIVFQPDVVTVYSGYNETRGLGRSGLLLSASKWSLVLNFLRVLTEQSASVTRADIERELRLREPLFLQGLGQILALTRKHGIALIPLTQQASSLPVGMEGRKGITYEEEMGRLNSKLHAEDNIGLLEGKLLIHQGLMNALKEWSEVSNLKIVDIVQLLDHHRHLLSTYVHLFPLGNELIALAIADQLANTLDCPSLATLPD